MAEMFLLQPSTKIVQAVIIRQKTWPPGDGACFRYISIYTQSLIGITFYESNFAVQMYKFMTEFALRILNIIFGCNLCISLQMKEHTFHTLQMNPCTLKILRNSAFEPEQQNC